MHTLIYHVVTYGDEPEIPTKEDILNSAQCFDWVEKIEEDDYNGLPDCIKVENNTFEINEKVRNQYLAPLYSEFKSLADSLTFKDFANGLTYDLEECLNDRCCYMYYGAVYSFMEWLSFMSDGKYQIVGIYCGHE